LTTPFALDWAAGDVFEIFCVDFLFLPLEGSGEQPGHNKELPATITANPKIAIMFFLLKAMTTLLSK